MSAVSGVEPASATQCLDICQALVSQGVAFNFSLTTNSDSTFTFTLDTRGTRERVESTKPRARKKPSPSTLRRNERRRRDFLEKKAEAPPEKPSEKPEVIDNWSSRVVNKETSPKSVKLRLKKLPPQQIPQFDGVLEEVTVDAEVQTAELETRNVAIQATFKSTDAETQTSKNTNRSSSPARWNRSPPPTRRGWNRSPPPTSRGAWLKSPP